jgi:hypothetical protein
MKNKNFFTGKLIKLPTIKSLKEKICKKILKINKNFNICLKKINQFKAHILSYFKKLHKLKRIIATKIH